QRQLADFLEILEVLGVGQRIAALDEVDAYLIQPAGEEELVLQREVDALALAAVAEGGVVDADACHGFCLFTRKRPRGGCPEAGMVSRCARPSPSPGYCSSTLMMIPTRRTPCATVMAIGIRSVGTRDIRRAPR